MAFDQGRGYRLDPQVALRREEFGALAYHYLHRRLLFLKSQALVEVLEHLEDHASAEAAVAVVTDSPRGRTRLLEALADLEASGVISAR